MIREHPENPYRKVPSSFSNGSPRAGSSQHVRELHLRLAAVCERSEKRLRSFPNKAHTDPPARVILASFSRPSPSIRERLPPCSPLQRFTFVAELLAEAHGPLADHSYVLYRSGGHRLSEMQPFSTGQAVNFVLGSSQPAATQSGLQNYCSRFQPEILSGGSLRHCSIAWVAEWVAFIGAFPWSNFSLDGRLSAAVPS